MKPIALALLVLALGGCAAIPAPVPAPIPTNDPISAETTCTDLSNMLTLISNAEESNRAGRMNGQELTGAVALADALLLSVDVEPDTALADEVSILTNLGAEHGVHGYGGPADNEDSEWHASIDNVMVACEAEGAELYRMGWTGG